MPLFQSISGWLLLLSSLALVGACTDPTTGTTTVSGQVVEAQSRKPVGGGTVQVWQVHNGGYRAIGSAYDCDAQGRFSFDFDAESKRGYLLKAQAPPGYFTDWDVAPDLTAGRKNTDVIVPMLAPAWLRFVLVDEPPKSRVSIFITGYSGNGDRLDYPRDTILIRPALANFPRKAIWVITDEKGIDTRYEQAMNLASLDTVTVRIPF